MRKLDLRCCEVFILDTGGKTLVNGPAGRIQIAGFQSPTSKDHSDIADGGDHVLPQLLGPMPLTWRSVSQRSTPHKLERMHQRGVRHAVHATTEKTL